MAKRGPKPRAKTILPLTQSWAPPSHLGEVSRAEFQRVANLLRQRGDQEKTDVQLVVRRAELIEISEACYAQIAKDGVVIASDRGNIGQHPAARLLLSATESLRRIDETLGMTPSSATASSTGQADAAGYGKWHRHVGGTS